jgi:hypothetical protein
LSNQSGGSGVWGDNSGGGAGVTGTSDKPNGVGIYGRGGSLAGHFQGNVEIDGDLTVSGDVQLLVPKGDCAEDFEMLGGQDLGPGSVVVIDSAGALKQSDKAYDKRVAGVISGARDLRPGIVLGRQQAHEDNRMPVALVGRVYCKVDARYASVEVGDLLTTSPTPGHAMKAHDHVQAFGAVIGKALDSIESGQGLIPILVALQ